MLKIFKWIVALGCTLFVLRVSSYVFPEFACLILSGIVLVALVVLLSVALVAGLSKWRKVSRLWAMPALLCIGFICSSVYLASPTGQYLSDKIFKKHLGDYAKVVDDFRNDKVLCAPSCNGDIGIIKAAGLPNHVQDIQGTHCDGGLIVLFRLNTDVPLLHEGYMFRDYEHGDNCSKVAWPRAPYVRQLTANWYRFSDQPGF